MAVGKGSILRAAGASAQSKAENGSTVHFIAAPDEQTEKLIKEKIDKEENKETKDVKKENGGSKMAEEKEVKMDVTAEEAVKAADAKTVQDAAAEPAKEAPAEEKKAAAPRKTAGRPAGKKTAAKTDTAKAAAAKAAVVKKAAKPAVKKTPARKPAASKAAEKKAAEPKTEQKSETKQEPAVNQGRERHPVNKDLPVYLL